MTGKVAIRVSPTTGSRLSTRWLSEALIGMWIFTLVTSFARPPVGTVAQPAKFILAALLSGWLLLSLPRFARGSELRRPRGLTLFFVLWILAAYVTLFRAPFPASGLALIGTYVLLYLLGIHLLPIHILRMQSHVQVTRIFFWSVAAAIVLLVVLGWRDAREFVGPPDRIRYQAFFRHPNFLGYYVFLGGAIGIRLWALTGRRLYLLAPVGSEFLLLFLVDSRTAALLMVLLPVTMVVFVGIGIRRGPWRPLIIGVLWSTVMLGLMAALYYQPELPNATSINALLSGRLERWSEALQGALSSSVLLGRGYGREGLGSLSVDSFWISTAVQGGMVGTAALSAFVLAVAWSVRPRGLPRERRRALAAVFPFSLFIVLIIYGFTENVLYSLGNPLTVYVWIEVGIALRCGQGRRGPRPA